MKLWPHWNKYENVYQLHCYLDFKKWDNSGHFSADDMISDKHHVNNYLILENRPGDIMEKQKKYGILTYSY